MMHPSITKATVSGVATSAELHAAAEYLAAAMKRIHGGSWSIDINHNSQYLSICRDFNDPQVKPKRECA